MKESLDLIRGKIMRQAIDFTQPEKLALSEVYAFVTKLAGKERVLQIGCSSCVNSAVHILYNYITYHEEIVVTEKPIQKANTITVTIDSLNDLTKAELMQQCASKGIVLPRNANKQYLIDQLS